MTVLLEDNYVIKLLRLQAEGKLSPPAPGLWHVEIQHDSWCGTNCGRRCNCDPDVFQWPHNDPGLRRKLT